MAALSDYKPKSHREIVKATGIGGSAAYNALAACWKKGLVLRTKKPIYEFERIFKGRGGMTQTTRPYHLYVLRLEGVDSLKSHDTNLARTLSETEKQVDSMYFEYLDRLVEKAPATNKCTISSVLVVRYLERIADHATYIGESIIYLATGEKVTLR